MTYLCSIFFLVHKLSVRYYGKDKKELGTARLYLTAVGKLNHNNKINKNKNKNCSKASMCTFNVICGCELLNLFFTMQRLEIKYVCLTEISLDVDADRDGVVEKNNPNKVR